MVKKYIEDRRPIDREFVDHYIGLFDNFSGWLTDVGFVFRGRLLVTDAVADVSLVHRLFPAAPGNEDYKEISAAVMPKIQASLGTKVIIINSGNHEKLALIRNAFKELAGWQPDGGIDFVKSFFLNDGTWLIVFNNVHGTTADKFKTLVLKE